MKGSPEVETSEDGFAVLVNNRLSAILGVASSILAIAYLGRALDDGGFVDAVATLLFGAIGIHQLWTVFDARVPLVTADATIVRVRLGREWLGLPWSTIEQIVVEQREGPIRDGRLIVIPRNLGNALEALPPGARRTVAWQKRLHGAPLTVPLSIATRNVGVSRSVGETLTELSRGRAAIVVLQGHDATSQAGEGTSADTSSRRSGLIGSEAPAEAPSPDVVSSAEVQTKPLVGSTPVAAARSARPVFRAEVIREKSRQMPGVAQAMRDAAADAITPINSPRAEVEWSSGSGVVPADRVQSRQVANPVIGPKIRAARERAGLTVDALSERTSIRPHVLEGIEVDDFQACGGDFYARGHLRTLARFLGLNPADLVDMYDEHYARAPISARRVFEAELATSLGSGVRVRSGGPRWSLIAAAVLMLMLVWGVARFLVPQSAPVDTASLAGATAPTSTVSTTPITSPLMKKSTLVLGSLAWSTDIVVSTVARTGHPSTVVWQGALRSTETKTLVVTGPFSVQASQATLTTVSVNGQDQGKIGTLAGPGTRTFK